MSAKMIILEGNSNDKDNVRAYMVKGEPGKDGISPSASVSKTGDTATITVTDKEGTTTATIDDGISPTATVSKSNHVATITITDEEGTTTASVSDGADLTDGAVPTNGVIYFDGEVANIPGGYEISEDLIYKNAGAHNSIYRGKDITDLFYNGTLSQQIAAGTFDEIFVGDYIVGKNSGRKYLVADINYRLHTGDTELTRNHVLMIPEKTMGTAKMNDSDTTAGAYVGSKMYTNYLTSFKTIINNDFGSTHILSHKNYLKNAANNGYETNGTFANTTIDLMTEIMVYGTDIFHNIAKGTNQPYSYLSDKSQLALFRYRPDLMTAFNDNNERETWWLRDVANASAFASVANGGYSSYNNASASRGVRPAFLIY